MDHTGLHSHGNPHVSSRVPIDVHLWTCIMYMKSVAIVSVVVHSPGNHLKRVFFVHSSSANSELMWHLNTKKRTMDRTGQICCT